MVPHALRLIRKNQTRRETSTTTSWGANISGIDDMRYQDAHTEPHRSQPCSHVRRAILKVASVHYFLQHGFDLQHLERRSQQGFAMEIDVLQDPVIAKSLRRFTLIDRFIPSTSHDMLLNAYASVLAANRMSEHFECCQWEDILVVARPRLTETRYRWLPGRSLSFYESVRVPQRGAPLRLDFSCRSSSKVATLGTVDEKL